MQTLLAFYDNTAVNSTESNTYSRRRPL